jgi:hypothetical protein
MNLSTLKSLQSRIREATGADRELDIAIWDALDPTETIGPPGPRIESSIAPPYTTDPDGLGACVALMREVLPGAIREVEATGKLPKVTVWRYHDIVWQARSTEEHAIENHATLLAIISARIAELEAEQEKERVGS